jgi:hypothetical protein
VTVVNGAAKSATRIFIAALIVAPFRITSIHRATPVGEVKMHIAFRKDLGNGTVTMTSAGNWDGLKYQLSKLDYFDTRDWDGFGLNHLRDGAIVNDGAALWRYVNIEINDVYGFEIFEGRIVSLQEIDPMFG